MDIQEGVKQCTVALLFMGCVAVLMAPAFVTHPDLMPWVYGAQVVLVPALAYLLVLAGEMLPGSPEDDPAAPIPPDVEAAARERFLMPAAQGRPGPTDGVKRRDEVRESR
jgi:hypothetical protein